jgi:YHS domain-containing protein
MVAKQKNNAVEYDGHCAFALSTGKTDVLGEKHSSTIDGKTYLFSNPVAKILFRILPNRINKANEAWKNK